MIQKTTVYIYLVIQLNKISDEEEKLKFLAQTLDMPPPWSPKIYIDKDKYLKGSLLG